MNAPRQITLDQWDTRYGELRGCGLVEPAYGGPLSRHVSAQGDRRLVSLLYDDSPAALRLWNFLLTEEQRLFAAAAQGKRIVATMKDLGTAAVLAWSLRDAVAFYPDGAWWIPCVTELTDNAWSMADELGFDESFCPVRAMLGAMTSGEHYPRPDLLTCSVGATCDDFSAIAQQLEHMGYPILWWEMPARRRPDAGEVAVHLPGGFVAPACQVELVQGELGRIRQALAAMAGADITDRMIEQSIAAANVVRGLLRQLRDLAYEADPCPLGALEMLVAEMLAIHYCSDRDECIEVLTQLLAETRRRAEAHVGVLPRGAVKVFWINPVADLRVMNLLEECGGRLAGTDYLFCHALDEIPQDCPPMEALARTALADPMAGPLSDRADRICRDIERLGSQAVVISRIGGASHCAYEKAVLAQEIHDKLNLPVLELEVPPLSDSVRPSLRTRLQALVETVRKRSIA